MKKRILCMLLAVLMLCALLPHTAFSALAVKTAGDCGENVTWSFDMDTGVMTISGSGPMWDFYSAPDGRSIPWENLQDRIKTVKIEGGVTRIGNYAFTECEALTSVSFNNKLESIGEGAFSICPKLTKLSFPKSLKTIERWAFEGCTSLSSVKLPDNLVSLWDGAFQYCSALTEITLPKNLKNLGCLVFADCDNLKRIVCKSNKPYVYLSFIYHGDLTNSFYPAEPVDCSNTSYFGGDYTKDMLGLHGQVEIYGYSTGAEGTVRKNESVKTLKDGELIMVKGDWAKYIGNYAKDSGYKFYPLDKFVDVKDGDAYQIPVAWAVGNKVTAGMDATHFAPSNTVTRAQAMTFFWAALKKPKFTKASTQFVDVKKTDWFYKSVMWAVEQGVTAGTDATHFSPNKTCNRGEILAFLYASLKKPKVSIKNPYKDVSNQWYKKAALWAYANGIEKGESGKFNASTPCTRASTVTYLYRFFTGMDLAN